MRIRNSGIKIYRTDSKETRRGRKSLSLFALRAVTLYVLMILWWNAFLEVFYMPFDKVWLYGGIAAAVLILETAVGKFGGKAVPAVFAAAAVLLWYVRDMIWELCDWTVQNYDTLFSIQPAGRPEFSYAAVLACVPVLLILIFVQRSGKGKGLAGLIICAPFLAAACAGYFQGMRTSWFLLMGGAAYFAGAVSGAGRAGKGIFLWKHAVVTVAVCGALAFLASQAGRLLDVGRASEDSYYFQVRGVLTSEVVGGIRDLLTETSREELTEPAESTQNEEPAESQDLHAQEEQEWEEPINSGLEQGESADADLGRISRFEPSLQTESLTLDEKPEETVYYAESWGLAYSDNRWELVSAETSDYDELVMREMCRTYPDEIQDTLADLCGGQTDRSLEDVSTIISRVLNRRAVYDTNPGAPPEGEEFLHYFLFENHRGFCVHFATAAALMYRYFGYEARYVEGYAIPASAFSPVYQAENGEERQYEAQITGEMGHAWCQVYDEQTGEWIVMEHTPPAPENSGARPPAASSDYEESIGEKIVYEILPVLIRGGLIVLLCAALFFVQAAVRTARREYCFRKQKDGEGIRRMYEAVVRTAGFQGVKIREPLDESTVETLYLKYPELEEREWKQLYECVMEGLFYHPGNEKEDWEKTRKFYARFRKAASGQMSPWQKWQFRYIYCL